MTLAVHSRKPAGVCMDRSRHILNMYGVRAYTRYVSAWQCPLMSFGNFDVPVWHVKHTGMKCLMCRNSTLGFLFGVSESMTLIARLLETE